MKKILAASAGFVLLIAASSAALAVDPSKMVGKWTWEGFVVEVTEGGEHGISAKVISGPKNVGMEMIQSKLEDKDGYIVGRIRHPANGNIYNTKLTNPDPDSWALEGCTDKGACAKGVFKRVK